MAAGVQLHTTQKAAGLQLHVRVVSVEVGMLRVRMHETEMHPCLYNSMISGAPLGQVCSRTVGHTCWVLHAKGLRTIGPHVAEAFCEIVKLRNRLARICGAEDFYDYTVKQAEGFSKRCAAGRGFQQAGGCAAEVH